MARYTLEIVCLKLSKLSNIKFMQYVGLCIFIYVMMIVTLCVFHNFIIIESEV